MAEQLPLQFEFRTNKTFADFFPGANQEAINHLQRCVAGIGERQIFLWGPEGLGKSHLLQACCHESQQQGQSAFYCNLSAINQMSYEILNGLDDYELVCLDNLDCIAEQSEWELALFNFYNQQFKHDHKLILAASCAPNQLALQLPDLVTRLNWGLTLKMRLLSDEDRIAALIFKASKMGFDISPAAGHFLLVHYHRDMQSLWDLLETLDKASLVAQRKLTRAFLKQILEDQEQK